MIVEQLIADEPFDLCLFLLGHTKVQDDLQLLFHLFSGEGSAFQQNLAQSQNFTFGKLLDLLRDQTVAVFFFVVLDSADDALFGALFCQKISDAVNIALDRTGIYMVLLCGFLLVDELAGKKGLGTRVVFKVSAVIGLSSSLFTSIITTKMDNNRLSFYCLFIKFFNITCPRLHTLFVALFFCYCAPFVILLGT